LKRGKKGRTVLEAQAGKERGGGKKIREKRRKWGGIHQVNQLVGSGKTMAKKLKN